jgi:hypothetical protein
MTPQFPRQLGFGQQKSRGDNGSLRLNGCWKKFFFFYFQDRTGHHYQSIPLGVHHGLRGRHNLGLMSTCSSENLTPGPLGRIVTVTICLMIPRLCSIEADAHAAAAPGPVIPSSILLG